MIKGIYNVPIIQYFSLGFDPYQPSISGRTLGSKELALSSTAENTDRQSRKLTTTTFSSTTTTVAATTSSRDQPLSTTPPTIVEVDSQSVPPTNTVPAGETNSSTVNGGQEATPTMTKETDESLSPPIVSPQLHPPSSHPQVPPSHHLPVSAPQPAASALSSHSSPSISSHPHPHPAPPPVLDRISTTKAHISADTHPRVYTRMDYDSGLYPLSMVIANTHI